MSDLERRQRARLAEATGDPNLHDRALRDTDRVRSGDLTPRELARASLIGWAGYASGGRWVCPPHLKLLAKKLADAAENPGRRLIVCMPPRHGKSELASKYFPAWFLGRHPTKRVLLASYGAEYASEWGGKVRDLLREHGPDVFGVQVARSLEARHRWALDVQGVDGPSLQTAGVEGAFTGKGADLLVIDDPIKSSEEAMSPTYRKRVWDWFGPVAYTRLEPGGSIVLVMTRWHEDDLAGRLLEAAKNGGEKWDVVEIPALAEAGDVLGRPVGAPLWPQRFGLADLLRIKSVLGEYPWSALYQQHPRPESGLHLQRSWLRYYTEPREGYLQLSSSNEAVAAASLLIFATVDLATSEDEEADFTAIGAWGLDGEGRLFLRDVVRERMQGPDIIPALERAHARWGFSSIYVEKAGFQLAILQAAWRAGLPGRELVARGNKVARFLPAAAAFQGSRIWLPSNASWLADYESEILAFNRGKHDDQVDVTSYAAQIADELHGLSGGYPSTGSDTTERRGLPSLAKPRR